MTTRRDFVAGAAAVAVGTLGAPLVARAQAAPIKIGVLHPVTGFVAQSGGLCRLGATMAIDDANKAGGIKSMGGAKIEAVLGDAQSKPDIGAAEVEKMNEAGVSAIIGAYASAICLATTQAAAKHGIPHMVDIGVADTIVTRGLSNTFRFGPGYTKVAELAVSNLAALNQAAGKPAKTAMIIHEESLFGTGTAGLLSKKLPEIGIEVKEVIKHANPTRDFNNIALRIKAVNPDIVIPANYYNEYVLLVRTMQQQRIVPKAIYSVLGGGASSYQFVKEFPEASNGIIDCNHWFNPKNPKVAELKKRVEAQGKFFAYEVFLTYAATQVLIDAIERAGSSKREAITAALASSTFANHIMPYGPTKFVNGQNEGAQPMMTQVVGGDIKVIFPTDFRETAPVFPLKA